ncbi:DNA topoisomerase IV subunit A [Furfurilactobacillus siliginis]|uniref:DNA topoisomerase 4 subunit A n=1 Tax=Furfurilactobacillus siliginis TaxID=348151 RepID=A0A0R2LB38_9LACO|nr:DNA topoisomerase IV subunit A [Furfurilactobacillus siliginis]KRN96997.1 DNA topoisomerase IV subunit A [Furfurilactobacillus siliginis]GEK27756.1 DNA topoisomerase 4 subunit A [Furfurilactobacillus siliginis]
MAEETSNIQELTLEDVMGERFGRYSKSIIQDRALPDIRDGLKPVQRRILYAMNKDGNTFDKGFRKSAKSVGNVMGNYHPHGDSSIYEAMVRMSQDWKLRAPLVEMHGNNGSIDADPPAAMRYTEARLSKISGTMLQDIDKDTVDFVPNFDDTEEEPTVLPARFPNLLVNGASGISAGYATEIPPHNLTEVLDALVYLLAHPTATTDDLMQFVKGPDFPTGGIIQGLDGIKKAYETGAGRIVLRSLTAIKPLKGNKQEIEITEIPYEVNKALLVKKMDEIRIMKKVEGIVEVRDESDRNGLTIAVELKADADAQGILTYLLKNTDLQITYNFNMVAIHNMRPERIGLKTALQAYIDFQREIITKRTQHDLDKAQKRQHIVEGLIKALSILDQVIATIRGSKNRHDAKQNLIDQYDFTEPQAEAIVTLQLYRLTNTDVTELQKEHDHLADEIARLTDILANDASLRKVMRTQMQDIKKTFGSDRLTQVEAQIEELKVDRTVTVADEDVIVMVSHDGYIKRSSPRSYQASAENDNGLKDEDYPILLTQASTLDHIFMFTSKGNMIYRPVHELADARWKDTGEHISQSIGLADDEELIAAFSFNSLEEQGNFVIATQDGLIKQTAFGDLLPGRTYKKHASMYVKFKAATDQVVNISYVDQHGPLTVMLMSQHGQGLRYDLAEVPTNGARTSGAKAMDLRNGDLVVNMQLVSETDDAIIVTQRGALKKMAVKEVPVTSRARKGVLCLRELKANPHEIAAFLALPAHAVTPVEIITTRGIRHDVLPADHELNARYSNGSFVVDVDTEGVPVSLRFKEISLMLN